MYLINLLLAALAVIMVTSAPVDQPRQTTPYKGKFCGLDQWGEARPDKAVQMLQQWRGNTFGRWGGGRTTSKCVPADSCVALLDPRCQQTLDFKICNDFEHEVCVPFTSVSNYLETTIYECREASGDEYNSAGQTFWADGTNVVVEECSPAVSEKRETSEPVGKFCGGYFGFVEPSIAAQTIGAWEDEIGIEDANAKCLGAHSCTRLLPWECNKRAQPRMCNDNDYEICVLHEDLHRRLEYTKDDCSDASSGRNSAGQTLYGDGTNVIFQECSI